MCNFAKVASQFKFVNSSIFFKQLSSVPREKNFVVQGREKKKRQNSLLEVEIQQKESGCS